MGSPVGLILGVDVGRWEGLSDGAVCVATIVGRLIAAATCPGQSRGRLSAQLVRDEKGRGLVEILTLWGQSL